MQCTISGYHGDLTRSVFPIFKKVHDIESEAYRGWFISQREKADVRRSAAATGINFNRVSEALMVLCPDLARGRRDTVFSAFLDMKLVEKFMLYTSDNKERSSHNVARYRVQRNKCRRHIHNIQSTEHRSFYVVYKYSNLGGATICYSLVCLVLVYSKTDQICQSRFYYSYFIR